LFFKKDSLEMPADLKTRLNKLAQHLIDTNKCSARGWKSVAARVAGCSYQNMRAAAIGSNGKMDAGMLRKLAVWADVSVVYMTDGIGPLLKEQPYEVYHTPEEHSLLSVAKRELDKEIMAMDKSGLSIMALQLAKEFDAIKSADSKIECFTRCVAILARAQTD
jgi:hypothetical protein